MRKAIFAIVMFFPLFACDEPQGTSSQQAARSSETTESAKTAQQPGAIPRIGPRGDRMAGNQPQPATGTVPNDASGSMDAPNSLTSGASDPQLQRNTPQQQKRPVGTSRPTPYGSGGN